MKLFKKLENIFRIFSLRFVLSSLLLCSFSSYVFAQSAEKSIELTYGEHPTYDRFVFQSDSIPKYEIAGNTALTTIVFDGKFDIKSNNIGKYPRQKLIRNEVLEDGKTRFIIPAPKVKTFELKDANKIVIDVKPYAEIKAETSAPFFKIDEVRVIEPQRSDDVAEETNKISQEKIQEIEKEISVEAPKEMTVNEVQASTENLSVSVINSEGDTKQNRKSVSLSFSWSDRVGMATFLKNGYLWVVFDKSKVINTQEIADLTKGYIYEIVQLPHPTATILRLKIKDDIYVGVRKESLLWVVDLFNEKIKERTKNLTVNVSYATQNSAYLFVPTSTAGNVVMTFDPETGDLLMVAPNFDPNIGITKNYKYPEFDILSSLQGFVVEPFADDIILTRNNSGLTIRAMNRGLNISPNIELLKEQSSLLQKKDWIKYLADDLPQHLVNLDYSSTYASLMNKINQADEKDKNARRLELAKYLNAKALGSNAIGPLQEIIKSEDVLSKREDVHGQLGISYFLTQRYEDAIKELSYGKLEGLNEAKLWKTLSEAAMNPQKKHNKIIASFIPVIRTYPAELRLRVAMVGLETAAAAGDDVTAQSFMDIIKSISTKRKVGAFLDYWAFEVLSMQGYSQTALARLKSAAMSTSAKYSAYARKKMTMLDYKSNKLSKQEAISELERIKYVWGEEKFQISLLEDLYDIYISSGDYYNALKNMQELLKLCKPERKQQLTTEMVAIFENIFINNNAGNLTPIQALALFSDFEWLTENSNNYTQIVINLADRLVYVDLLNRADNLLRKYVNDKSMSPKDRALIGARLALINIFTEHNYDALKFLDETESENLPDYIQSQRRIIRAKALIGLERNQEAINVLEKDTSMNATVLKSDLYWRTGQWSLAADSLKKQIVMPKEGEKLDDRQASLIIDWITALRKAKKDTIVVLARDKFLPFFKDNKYYSAFNILTNNVSADEIDIRNLNSFIRDIDSFRNFAKTYNEALGSNSYIEAEAETEKK